jgi:hypothetical protein
VAIPKTRRSSPHYFPKILDTMTQTHFSVEDKEILRDLFKESKMVSIYSFHKKYMLSPGQLSRSLRKFESMGVLVSTDENVELTEYGKKWILQNRKELFLNKPREFWKESITESVPNSNINKPYLPKKTKLNKDFFKSLYFRTKLDLGALDSST